MDLSVAEYKNQLAQLLPKGQIWDVEPGGELDGLLDGMAAELARIDRRGQDLLDEADPRTTYELLDDWERVFGLPDACTGPGDSIDDRRRQLVLKMTMLGGQSIAFFISLGAAYGYDLDVEEYRPARIGDVVGDRIYGTPWVHVFSIISSSGSIRVAMVNQSYIGQRIRDFGDDVLECVISRAKPAHSRVLFEYL